MFFAIIMLFAMIHFIEFSSYYARIAGIRTDYKLVSYTLQQTTFVMTRFFFVFLMPIIGYIIDKKISKNDYVLIVIFSLTLASFSYLLSFLMRNRIIYFFTQVIYQFTNGKGFLTSFFSGLINSIIVKKSELEKRKGDLLRINKKVAIFSSIIFCCYSIAVFLSFYFALLYYDLRATIGQTSGVINALATLILTFYIEPKISKSIDSKSDNAEYEIYSLLLGRFIGVSVISISIFFLIFVLQ